MAAKTKKKSANQQNLTSISQSLSEKATATALISLTNVKTVISKSIDEMANEVSDNLKELKDLRDAVRFEKDNLKKLYDLGIELDQIENIRAHNQEELLKLKQNLSQERSEAEDEFAEFEKKLDRDREEFQHNFNRDMKFESFVRLHSKSFGMNATPNWISVKSRWKA